jgi:hypothetical protein
MARSINSPGVEIVEKDFSQYQNIIGGTTIYLPGFAPQGPTDEVLQVTSISEFEAIYGTPQSAAERYFYYSAKEILNSPANLLTTRLPYGSGFGEGFANDYSALLFPVASAGGGNDPVTFQIGQPKFITLTEEQYINILQNNVTWSPLASTSADLSGSLDITPDFTDYNFTNTGFVICNNSKTAQNELFEGYYLAVTDNKEFDRSSDFTAVSRFFALSGRDATSVFPEVPSSKYDFALSASVNAGGGSISQVIESAYDWTISQDIYNDVISINLFKVRRSVYDPQVLTISPVENHLGSFNSQRRREASVAGAPLRTFFVEDVVNNVSPNLRCVVNPSFASNSLWTGLSAPQVRIHNPVRALYPNSNWLPTYEQTDSKSIGRLIDKIDRALVLVETTETVPLDIIVDAGLSTIYTVASGNQSYDDTVTLALSTYNEMSDDLVLRYRTAYSRFANFVSETRKDCMFISDPLRQIFVQGDNTKTLSRRATTFTQNIFNPLKSLYETANNNYTATYGNWARIYDSFTDRNSWIPFSGYAAAVYARTDRNTQPWFAPAGLNRGVVGNILDLAINPNQKQRDQLYTIGVNPVVFFSGDGFVVYGQKTLQNRPTAFDRINVRRLFLTLERATQRALRYFVFEPNTEFTRTRLKNTISPIFELARNTEGVYDYLIVCDERNNTPDTVDRNELVVDIYIKPVKAAEFILVNFIATRTGQNFQELI